MRKSAHCVHTLHLCVPNDSSQQSATICLYNTNMSGPKWHGGFPVMWKLDFKHHVHAERFTFWNVNASTDIPICSSPVRFTGVWATLNMPLLLLKRHRKCTQFKCWNVHFAYRRFLHFCQHCSRHALKFTLFPDLPPSLQKGTQAVGSHAN